MKATVEDGSDSGSKTALVACYSVLVGDPRVRKQIAWLIDAGWRVDTLGLGPSPLEAVSEHHQIKPVATGAISKVGRGLSHLVLTKSARFKFLVSRRIPRTLSKRLSTYDALVINEIDLLPWFSAASLAPGTRVHLDLHEYHEWDGAPGGGRLMRRRLMSYYLWMRSKISDAYISSRSTVAEGIATKYAAEFRLPSLTLVYNSIPFCDLHPQEVLAGNIRLIHHGFAELRRGIDLLLEASRMLGDAFTLTLMLNGPADKIREVRDEADRIGAKVVWKEPVAMAAVPSELNAYDAEVVFFPPRTTNLEFTLPNKYFEAVQGRLAIVSGDSPSLVNEIVKRDNGFVIHGWSAEALAQGINSLTPEQINAAKKHSHAAAGALSSDADCERFLACLA